MTGLFSTRTRLMVITLPLVLVPLAIVLALNSLLTGSIIKSFIFEKLDHSNQQINENFDLFAEQLENSMRRVIVNSDVQQSLSDSETTHVTLNAINSFLKFYDYGAVRVIAYMDNAGNIVQTHKQNPATRSQILNSHAREAITGTYGKQVWTFREDDIFGDAGRYIFITRYIRHLDLNVSPGILIFKIDPEILYSIFADALLVQGADYLLVDQQDNLVFHSQEPGLVGRPVGQILDYEVYSKSKPGIRVTTPDGDSFVFSYHVNKLTGWKILGVVPYQLAIRQLRGIQTITYIIMALAALGTVAVVYFTTLKFTNPIHDLEQAMHRFRDGNFDTRVKVQRDDEIGEMGKSFNQMADEIGSLLRTIKKDQEDLTTAELESLAYQINPHFVYNTLDNIHMLARTSGDDRISRLILSLTKFLRIGLSKGHNIISLADEFTHVEHYLNIQKIRFGNSFDFDISLDPNVSGLHIVKFVLQPLAENSINHGFQDMETGGFLEIRGLRSGGNIKITVEDNGRGIDVKTRDKLNGLIGLPTEQVLEAFPKREGGYGIGNVVARLNIYYGEGYSLTFSSSRSGGTICTITFSSQTGESSEPRKEI